MSSREGYHWSPRPWAPSDVQARILDGVARGLTNAQIAVDVGISPDGVKWHISRALSETGLDGRSDLALWWQSPRSSTDIRLSAVGSIDMRLDHATSMRAMVRSFAGRTPMPLVALVPPQRLLPSGRQLD